MMDACVDIPKTGDTCDRAGLYESACDRGHFKHYKRDDVHGAAHGIAATSPPLALRPTLRGPRASGLHRVARANGQPIYPDHRTYTYPRASV